MAGETPEDVFNAAQLAMQSGDWFSFFDLMDNSFMKKILKNGINLSMTQHSGANQEFANICAKHNIPLEELVAAWKSRQPKEYKLALDKIMKRATDLSSLTASIELHTRSLIGAGSISKGILVGDELVELEVSDKTATAIRIVDGQHRLPIKFTKKRDGWYFKLVAPK